MGIFDWLFGAHDGCNDNGRLRAAVDKVIEGTDPRLKAMSGARERLAPAVEHALAFVQQAVAKLPPAIELTPANWSASPLLHAMFTRPADITDALAMSGDVRDFMKTPAAATMDTFYGVLAATHVERKVLGSAMEGEMLRQDVAQTTVSFADLRIAGFAATEAEIRIMLEDFAIEQLVLAALRDIAEDRQRSDQLSAYRQLLRTRLRLLEQGEAGSLLESMPGPDTDIARLRSQLAANEAELNELKTGSGTLDGMLEPVLSALHGAEEIIRPHVLRIRLNAMNIVARDDEPNAADIALAEFCTSNPERPRRVGALIRFARSDFVERAVDFDALLRSI